MGRRGHQRAQEAQPGRVRALAALRAERSSQIRRQGTAAMAFDSGTTSGKKVVEATGIAKAFGDKTILRPFDLRDPARRSHRLCRAERRGQDHPGQAADRRDRPDQGTVTMGTNLEIAVFDQARAALNPDQTLWESLTGDPEMRVSGRADQVMVRGQPKHVVAYLKDFLFDDAQARAPVRSLSGGEGRRLLLARLMARPSNLLVMDEPTNDLDVETLDLLQDLLGEYDGTVLLVSHDRDFIDRVADTTVAMEGDGRATVYAGGWSDYQAQRGETVVEEPVAVAKTAPVTEKPKAARDGLSFTERHRLDALPGIIAKPGGGDRQLSEFMSDPTLFQTASGQVRKGQPRPQRTSGRPGRCRGGMDVAGGKGRRLGSLPLAAGKVVLQPAMGEGDLVPDRHGQHERVEVAVVQRAVDVVDRDGDLGRDVQQAIRIGLGIGVIVRRHPRHVQMRAAEAVGHVRQVQQVGDGFGPVLVGVGRCIAGDEIAWPGRADRHSGS